MKKIILLLCVVPLLIAMQCDDDVPCGTLIEFEKNDLIALENQQATYEVGDTLWISSTVNRFQTNPNTNSTLDLFELDEKLAYYIEIKKASAFNEFNYINLNENSTIVEEGESLFNTIILVKEGEGFRSKIGIKLLETGTFTVKVHNVASYSPERQGCNFTVISMVTDFDGIENNLFTFDVE